ncbi:unnamed protein product [Urochloa humidicola]
MAPRSRLLDLETHDNDALFFYYGDSASVATHAIVFWPVLLAAAVLLLHLVDPFTYAAAACAGLYGAYYCFVLGSTARRGSPPLPSHTSGTLRVMAGLCDREQNSS